jgi:hypothetical protein
MKRHRLCIFCFLSVALAVTPQSIAPQPTGTPLAKLMPAGPLLYVESPDFAALLHDWNDSSDKKAWLASDNYRVFSRSRLFLRLQEAQEEFAVASGATPDMALFKSVAGSESALALYDIGNLEFLYITRLPAARALDNALGRGKEKFKPRKVVDTTYYVHAEPTKNRLVAFATVSDYLLVATREDLMAGALSALSGKAMHTLADQPWYASATGARGRRGDLRLALNLEGLAKSPHFRSYWIQRNVSMLRQYSAEVADVYRSADEIREERLLLRAPVGAGAPEPTPTDDTALAGLLRLVPEASGVYRAWSTLSAAQVLGLLQQKLLAPQVGRSAPLTLAPAVALSEGQTGTEGDFETRIDAPPLTAAGDAFEPEALKKLLAEVKLAGALQLESTRALPGDVFVGTQSALVLEAAGDWNGEAVRAALVTAVQGLWTTSGLGAKWVQRGAGEAACFELDGLTRLAMAVRGHLLIVGTASGPVVAVLNRLSNAPRKDNGVYAAGFRHGAERGDIVKMTRLIEAPLTPRFQGPGGHEPWFFSENLASLSQSLARVESESILVRNRGPAVTQTVVYRLSK